MVVDDQPFNLELMEEILGQQGYGVRSFARGRLALAAAAQKPPDLILLDLNLPRKDGRQVLAEIKGSDDLKRIPVVVLTTSQSEYDLEQAYGLHANCYLVKPVDFDEFKTAVQSVQDFWFGTVRLPRRTHGDRP